MFRKEIYDLHDDRFDGSLNVHQIFTKVFFDNSESKRKCNVTGNIKFERDDEKGNIGHGKSYCSKEAISRRKVHERKELSNTRPHLRSSLNSLGSLDAAVEVTSEIVTHHVVESYNKEVICGCYLQKLQNQLNRENEIAGKDALILKPSKFNEKDVVSKDIVSSVSLKNRATESHQANTIHLAQSKDKDSSFTELDESEFSRSKESPNVNIEFSESSLIAVSVVLNEDQSIHKKWSDQRVVHHDPKKRSLSSLDNDNRQSPKHRRLLKNDKDNCLLEVPVYLGNETLTLWGRTEAVINNRSSVNFGKRLYLCHEEESKEEFKEEALIKDVSLGAKSYPKMKVRKKSKLLSEIILTDPQQHDTVASNCKAGLSSRKGACKKSKPKKCKKLCVKDGGVSNSATVKNKASSSAKNRSFGKSKPLKKKRQQKGHCRLLLRGVKRSGGKQPLDGKWPAYAPRTVLSWLIHSGTISTNEVIQYREGPQGCFVVKDGSITREGILCKCCGEVLSISKFKSHAGCKLNHPSLNLFMETSNKPFIFCQLEAWLAEYKAKKPDPQAAQLNAMDQNDDSCGRCGEGGELICCDNCPSTFHQACLYAQELPEGSWYCSQCACRECGDVVKNTEVSAFTNAHKCIQCEHRYHEACLKQKGMECGVASDHWSCSDQCEKVYTHLKSLIGLPNQLSDGFSWTLLKCIPRDKNNHSVQQLPPFNAECNSKLAVALTIMEESFLPMVDPKTGIDMIPQVIYNRRSHLGRLDYCGFYTAVLEDDDIIVSVASIRIHGTKVAELPLIATCTKYRRKGMCRRLMNCIEEMLKSLKVEKLVLSAIPSLVDTWTMRFGFEPFEENDKRSLSDINMMVFPGSVWLKKSL
ncbi:unnamed protein product [Cuscuta epithymum]|uniref:Histone acetyltransferase n=1 Tax=Cuscuta epithymum TaxID=186058 RepID=A0AAV0DNH6_9ASTE|nr:unnamed protein product [Cuscuta epithymum]